MGREGAVPEVRVFTEIRAETVTALLENNSRPFEAYDRYQENYSDRLSP